MPTPRQRVMAALRGGCADRVPFTMYERKIPQCAAERTMRNRGLCIVYRTTVYATHRPNVKHTTEVFHKDGKEFARDVYETPKGTLTTLCQRAGFTSWWHEKMFKSPDDYAALLFLIQDECFQPAYEAYTHAEQAFGEDAVFRAGLGGEPMQQLISGLKMSMQDYCLQWMENRDEVLKLYDAIVESQRKVYPIVAESPASHANYGGNVVPEVIGLDGFRRYYVSHYNEAAEALHKHGKLIGCHLDANCRLLSEAIAATDLDFIEAFTPAPDTDMSLGEARAAWPDKALWINFPSSVHLRPGADVEQAMVDMLDEVPSSHGILVGITEDIPEHRWRDSCRAIMDGLERHARERPERYA